MTEQQIIELGERAAEVVKKDGHLHDSPSASAILKHLECNSATLQDGIREFTSTDMMLFTSAYRVHLVKLRKGAAGDT